MRVVPLQNESSRCNNLSSTQNQLQLTTGRTEKELNMTEILKRGH